MSSESSTLTLGSDAAPPRKGSSAVVRFWRALPRSAQIMLVFSTTFFLWFEAQCASGLWLMMGAHVRLRNPWMYILAIFFPWVFCVRALWLVTRMSEAQRDKERTIETLMLFLAGIPFWSYFLLGLGIAFATAVAGTKFTLPFF